MLQRQINFGDPARLEAHLSACGVAAGQAALAALILRHGRSLVENGNSNMVALTISSRDAAQLLGCSRRAVPKSAAALARLGLATVVEHGNNRPPTYCLDLVAARTLTPAEDCLDLRDVPDLQPTGPPPEPQVGTHWAPVGTGGHRVGTAGHLDHALTEDLILKTHALPYTLTPSMVTADECPPVPSCAQLAEATQVPAAARRWPLPWSEREGLTDGELQAAVLTGDVEALAWLFAVAKELGWIVAPRDAVETGHDVWLRFLTGCHHAATARLRKRKGRLVAFVKGNATRRIAPLDVSRMSQRSEEWARRAIRARHQDPALATRMMRPEL